MVENVVGCAACLPDVHSRVPLPSIVQYRGLPVLLREGQAISVPVGSMDGVGPRLHQHRYVHLGYETGQTYGNRSELNRPAY